MPMRVAFDRDYRVQYFVGNYLLGDPNHESAVQGRGIDFEEVKIFDERMSLVIFISYCCE